LGSVATDQIGQKSIISVLVGIALDKGCLSSIEEPVYPYMKDRVSHWDFKVGFFFESIEFYTPPNSPK